MITIAILLAGCAQTTGVTEHRATKSFEGRCAPPAPHHRATPLKELAGTPTDGVTPEAAVQTVRGFSWQSLKVAEAIEILPLLRDLAVLETVDARKQPDGKMRLLKVRQQIFSRIALANLEVSSSAAQAGCEEERAHQLADRL
ncbi:MAG: hypothetical protein ACREJU_11155, partial [Nitrospiraceae bacterium]